MENFAREFTARCIFHLEEGLPRIGKCLAQLSEAQIWSRPNDSSNSIGNLILHLDGNIRQWIVSGLGGAKDERRRDEEFEATGGPEKADLLAKITETTALASGILANCSAEKLMKKRSVQGYDYSGIGITVHVTEHYSYHIGQIAYRTKELINKDLSYYAGRDLTILNG